jgi:hypothetical protein
MMQTCDNLVHIRPNRTTNLLSTKKQLITKFRAKLQNKKVAIAGVIIDRVKFLTIINK